MKIVIEVLDSLGKLKERKFFSSFPVIIGRSFDSDLIISDPAVCPSHLEVDLNNENNISVKDLDSVNGLYCFNKKRNIKSFEDSHVAGSKITGFKIAEFKIGNTKIRAFRSDIEVAKTKALNATSVWSKRYKFGMLHSFLALLAFISFYFIDAYLLNYRTSNTQKYEVLISGLVGALGMFLPWAGVWALIGKVNINKARFWSHFSIPILATIIYMASKRVFTYLYYGLAQPSWLSFLSMLLSFVIIAFFLNYHLLYSTKILNRRRWFYSALASFLILGVFSLISFKNKFSFSSKLPLAYIIKPNWAIIKNPVGIDRFIDNIILEDE